MRCFYREVFFLLVLVSRLRITQTNIQYEVKGEDLTTKVTSLSEKIPLPDPNCPKEDDACQYDLETLDAIKSLHKQIDDDASGNIDVSESQEFFLEELQNTDRERQSLFHGKDDKISVEDLWRAWKHSTVTNWTVDDVLEWLIVSVELPQYCNTFKDKNINGSDLPRVAVNLHHFITKELGIKNPVHKHKLSLKAMDVVLFGPARKMHSILKDIALVTSILVALGGCWFAYRQNKSSKDQIQKMMKDLDSLQKAEDSLSELHERLKKAEEVQVEAVQEKTEIEQKYRSEIVNAKAEAERLKKERQDTNLEEMSRLQLAEEELIQVRAALLQAEEELESRGFMGAPQVLQQWLQYTFEMEQQHFNAKQQAAQRQFSTAKDACDKIRKKRTGMLGTLRIAQDNSIDDIDKRIIQARMALEEIRHDLQERQQRWQAIENLCNFPIRTNPGLAKLEYALYGDGASITSSTSSARLASMVAPLNVEDADEDFPPQYQAATAMLFSTKPNGCPRATASFSGLGSNLELKRRQVHMGSSSSLSKSPSQVLNSPLGARDSHDLGSTVGLHQKTSTSSSNGSHSMPVSFHLGNHSPASSPESPASDHIFPIESTSSDVRVGSSTGLSSLQNGSRIPKRDIPKPNMPMLSTSISQRSVSESSFQKKLLQKQTAIIGGGVGCNSSQDDDSLSGTESLDSEGKKKDKKRSKLIPKFMRKGD